ncbi:MAG: hypothetical protein IT429_19390 [Gemmataceae bacterium]|nr:hypothetical protein [Gemmataceae bacterium]
MQTRKNGKAVLEAEAVVYRVDPVSRELMVFIDSALVAVYVPPNCDVVLRGERVKFRMVQPRDCVRMRYADRAGSLVARAVEVRSVRSPSAVSR